MDELKKILDKRYGLPDEYQEYNEEVAEELQAHTQKIIDRLKE